MVLLLIAIMSRTMLMESNAKNSITICSKFLQAQGITCRPLIYNKLVKEDMGISSP